jgi:hypothetical protein
MAFSRERLTFSSKAGATPLKHLTLPHSVGFSDICAKRHLREVPRQPTYLELTLACHELMTFRASFLLIELRGKALNVVRSNVASRKCHLTF